MSGSTWITVIRGKKLIHSAKRHTVVDAAKNIIISQLLVFKLWQLSCLKVVLTMRISFMYPVQLLAKVLCHKLQYGNISLRDSSTQVSKKFDDLLARFFFLYVECICSITVLIILEMLGKAIQILLTTVHMTEWLQRRGILSQCW